VVVLYFINIINIIININKKGELTLTVMVWWSHDHGGPMAGCYDVDRVDWL